MMKKILFSIVFCGISVLFFAPDLAAQTTTQSSSISAPNSQVNPGHQNLSVSIVYRVLNEAQVPLNTPFQVLLSEYYNKNCKITCILIAPNGNGTFRVEYGGGGAVLVTIQINS